MFETAQAFLVEHQSTIGWCLFFGLLLIVIGNAQDIWTRDRDADLEDIRGDIASLQSEIDSLEGDLETANEKIASLEADMSALETADV